MTSHPNPYARPTEHQTEHQTPSAAAEYPTDSVDHGIEAPANVPAGFSHWEPGPDPMRPAGIAVDSAGHRWEQPDGDGPWRRLPAAEATALARDLYIHAHDADGAPQSWRDAGAREWDAGQAKPEDVADCYDRADQLITNRRLDADEF